MKLQITILFVFLSLYTSAQVSSVSELDPQYLNWYNYDLSDNKIMGTSVDRTYQELIDASKEKTDIIVAVIDGGVDISHEDLQGRIWVNEDEIPGNGIDDDQNGYIDDVHGWNFIGNANGENVHYENLEIARVFKSGDESNPDFARASKLYQEEINQWKESEQNIKKFAQIYYTALEIIKSNTGIEVKRIEDLKGIKSSNERVMASKEFLEDNYKNGVTEEGLREYTALVRDRLDYHLNLDFNPREVVGDNPTDINDRDYGNPDVKGARAQHGTSVAGVIAAVRGNDIGIDGIATHVKIMAIRSTPDGDERDKDVALAIRYAVDNGARVINMSFGKQISPEKEFVDEAVRYAEEKGVLLVHAAGNDGADIDLGGNFPTPVYNDGTRASNWLEIGASADQLDENVVGSFSNYGEETVDLFAPGVNIVSLDTMNGYSMHNGTSLAAPVVSGIAALILSEYPGLTPQEMVSILMKSTYKVKKPKKILGPTEEEKAPRVKFAELSRSGGIVNAYEALKRAGKVSQ